MQATAVRTIPGRALLATAAILAVLATLVAPPAAGSSERWPVWVAPIESALPSGARVLDALPVARALLVASPVAPAGAALAETPLGWKQLLEPVDLGWDEPVRLDSGVATTGAPAAWSTTNGAGAVVALVDTGVAPVPALQGAVAGEIDFSGTGGGDGYGHGTFLASLLASREATAPGVAPGALVLSLKVAGADGSTDLGRVLSALQWLHGPGRASGIRIAMLALGVDPATEAGEILDRATAGLANQGVLVVTAAGNDGAGQLTSPATSAGTLSVGAVDDQGDADPSNDVVADFSGSGHDRLGVPQPDLQAPGVNIVGSMPADSLIARTYPEATVEEHWFRGSGTSMATALTAGVAALVSAARPDFDGHDLEAALRAGEGRLDAGAALAEALAAPARPGNRPAGTPAATPTPAAKANGPSGKGNGPSENADPQGVRWVEATPWDGVRWVEEHWNGVRWVGVRWVGVRWVGVRWVDGHWGDENWEESVWGGVRWVGVRWVGVRWVGNGWAGDILDADVHAGVRWAGVRWAGVRWAGVRWAGVRWAWVPPGA